MAPKGPFRPFPKTRIRIWEKGNLNPKFCSFYPMASSGLMHERPGYGPFFAENPFSPANEFVLMGLVVRKCHFDVTACAEARRLAP